MSEDTNKRRENDALQSGQGDHAYGQDARDFGAGGQRVTKPIQGHQEDRDPTRDRSLEPASQNQSAAETVALERELRAVLEQSLSSPADLRLDPQG